MRREIDMLTGSLWDKILLFAVPVALTGILQQLFNAADIAVVGRFTGELSKVCIAAVGANSSIVSLTVNLFVGMAMGTNVVIAGAVGRGDGKTIRGAVRTAVVFSLLAGLAGAVVCEAMAEPVLRGLKVQAEVLPMAVLYLRIYMAGLPVILLYNFEAAVFRAVGDTRTPLVVLAVSGVLNVLFNLLFVAGFGMAVEGVAAATVLSNLVSAGLLLLLLVRTDSDIHVDLRGLGIEGRVLRQVLRIGVPAGVQTSMFSLANILIQSAINSLGTVAMAASSTSYTVEVFLFYVMSSFSQACTTFVGQNYGAGQIPRCKRALGLCVLEDFLCVAPLVLGVLALGRPILSIFNTDIAVVDTAFIRLRFVLLSYVFSLLYENTAGYLRGFGVSVPPAAITMLGALGIRIIWVYWVFPRRPAFDTIMAVYPVSLAATAVLMTLALLVLRPARRAQAAP